MNILKNRTVIGIACIAVSLLLCFAVTPLFNASLNKQFEVTVARDIRKGEQITAEMLKKIRISGAGLPSGVVKSSENTVGKYAAVDIVSGDFLMQSKLTDEAESGVGLNSLDGKRRAVSVTINSLASGVSGKLKSGDIVTVMIPDENAEWGVWKPYWHENWVWISTDVHDGYWIDLGWWEFKYDKYTAKLTAEIKVTPDTNCPTAKGKEMKSGYGINQRVSAKVSSNNTAAVTAAQTAVSYFHEFRYETYRRLLELTENKAKSTILEFAKNKYSTYNSKTHFTPIWIQDGKYEVYTYLLDCWTPAGMLSANLSDYVTIKGNLWDDWHIAKANP